MKMTGEIVYWLLIATCIVWLFLSAFAASQSGASLLLAAAMTILPVIVLYGLARTIRSYTSKRG
ncbi:DUF6358 family protein [Jannaschia donghaensis]|uniref:Uncharacterized protein n=1 Tax=Jannaschia donghaensis TaxID=420998 RepID=A0A0M6YEJ5_9RHOB|nr:DUF6358 family protein [Jannaschia donghaensis]CTQ48772.1 hypothetical protein JDO7802_00777 [Jannaschia donghaensis]